MRTVADAYTILFALILGWVFVEPTLALKFQLDGPPIAVVGKAPDAPSKNPPTENPPVGNPIEGYPPAEDPPDAAGGDVPDAPPENVPAKPVDPCSRKALAQRPYDILVYGSTGSLGLRAVAYLASHPEMPRFAIAGRNSTKVQALKEKFSSAAGSEVFALTDWGKMRQAMESTRVILNYAGPYERAGAHFLIKTAIDACTHYVDASVETNWKAQMLTYFLRPAKMKRVIIVQSAGFVSLAADLLAMLAAKRLAVDGEGAPQNVTVAWTKWNGVQSHAYMNATQQGILRHGPLTNPYILAPMTYEKSEDLRSPLDAKSDENLFDMPLVASTTTLINCPVIRRSMGHQFPNQAITVREVSGQKLYSDLAEWRLNLNNFRIEETGSPVWLSTGAFAGEAIAFRGHKDQNKAVRISLDGTGDPVYTASAKMSTEVALSLAQGSVDGKSGFLTPSFALGGPEKLQHRLEKVDGGQFIRFSIGRAYTPNLHHE